MISFLHCEFFTLWKPLKLRLNPDNKRPPVGCSKAWAGIGGSQTRSEVFELVCGSVLCSSVLWESTAGEASVGASMSLTGQGRAGVGGGRARREEFKLVFSGASCAPHNCFGQVEFYISISKTIETQKLQLWHWIKIVDDIIHSCHSLLPFLSSHKYHSNLLSVT